MLPFGETVLIWRLERGLTQEQLARAASVSRPNLSAIERGEREVTLKTLRALANALDVRPGVLVDGVAPLQAAGPLSREALERIAGAVLDGSTLRDGYERALVTQLRHLFGARLSRARVRRPRRGVRARDRAYFRLKALASREVVGSLVSRVSDRLLRS